mgnify:CR=1 FL=1
METWRSNALDEMHKLLIDCSINQLSRLSNKDIHLVKKDMRDLQKKFGNCMTDIAIITVLFNRYGL